MAYHEYEEIDDYEDIVIESVNPHGTLIASLENDGRTLYLYLNPVRNHNFQSKAVWVRNLIKAPDTDDVESARQGVAPMLKASICRHPNGAEVIDGKDTELVWFEDGVGVALFVKGRLETIIPPWSGKENLFGYSRDTLGKHFGTIPFPTDDSALLQRVNDARDFWASRKDQKNWENYRDSLLSHYESLFGKHVEYLAVTREYPMLAVVLFQDEDGGTIAATLGMGAQHMPGVEGSFAEPEAHFRVEVLTRYNHRPDWLGTVMADLALYPWESLTYFSDGQTWESGFPYDDSDYLFIQNYSEEILPVIPEYIADGRFPVKFLYAQPLTKAELSEYLSKQAPEGPFGFKPLGS